MAAKKARVRTASAAQQARAKARLAMANEQAEQAARNERVTGLLVGVELTRRELAGLESRRRGLDAQLGEHVRGLLGEGLTVDRVAVMTELEPRVVRTLGRATQSEQELVESGRKAYADRPGYQSPSAEVAPPLGEPDPLVSGTPVDGQVG